jgi:hypothetical protein
MQHHAPHKNTILSSLQEHVAAFVIAWLVVAWLTSVFFFRDGLAADITWWSLPKESSLLPIVYTVANGSLVVNTTTKFTDVTSITFFILFNPKSVLLQLEKATSPYAYTYAPGMENMVQNTIVVRGDLPAQSVVFTLPFTGIEDDVTIANAWVLWKNGTFESVAIQKK